MATLIKTDLKPLMRWIGIEPGAMEVCRLLSAMSMAVAARRSAALNQKTGTEGEAGELLREAAELDSLFPLLWWAIWSGEGDFLPEEAKEKSSLRRVRRGEDA